MKVVIAACHSPTSAMRCFPTIVCFAAQVIRDMDVLAHVEITTLRCNEGSSRCGVHHDPPAPLPALIAGPSAYALTDAKQLLASLPASSDVSLSPAKVSSLPSARSMSWNRVQRGGRLFCFDGMFDLSYGPQDLILLDGQYTHGVTVLRDLPGHNQGKGRMELERFCLIMFSRWQREKMKGEKRLREGHMSSWREAWRSGIVWSRNDEPAQVESAVLGFRCAKPPLRYRFS